MADVGNGPLPGAGVESHWVFAGGALDSGPLGWEGRKELAADEKEEGGRSPSLNLVK